MVSVRAFVPLAAALVLAGCAAEGVTIQVAETPPPAVIVLPDVSQPSRPPNRRDQRRHTPGAGTVGTWTLRSLDSDIACRLELQERDTFDTQRVDMGLCRIGGTFGITRWSREGPRIYLTRLTGDPVVVLHRRGRGHFRGRVKGTEERVAFSRGG